MQTTLIPLTGVLAIAQANPISVGFEKSLTVRDVIGNLPESAEGIEIDFQPLVDFDSDGCYQTSAIDESGKVRSDINFEETDWFKMLTRNSI
jgi:hypothetical protein